MSAWLQTRLWTALLVAATVAVVLPAVLNFQERREFRLPDDGVQWVDGQFADGTSGVFASRVVEDGPGSRAGIRPGDRLRRINSLEIRSAMQVGRVLAGLGVWSRASYGLERDGVGVAVPLVIGPAEPDQTSKNFQFLLAFIYLAIGLAVLSRQGARPMVRHFYVFCLLSFAVYGFSYTGALDGFDRFIYWADVWATLLVPAAYLHFCLIFPDAGSAPRWRRFLALLGYLPGVAMIALHHLSAVGAIETNLPLEDVRFLLDRADYALLGLLFVAGAVLLRAIGGRTEDVVVRQQRKWLAYGTLAGVLPFTAFWLWPYVMGEVPGPNSTLSVFSLGLIPLSFGYAIVRYRLMDVELIARRSLAATLATAGLLGGLYAGIVIFSGLFRTPLETMGPAVWVLSVVVAAALFHPLRNCIEQLLERRAFRDRYDHRNTLVDFASDLTTETGGGALVGKLAGRLAETLQLERLAIFVAADEGAGYRLEHALGVPALVGQTDFGFLDPEALRVSGRPYIYFENPAWRVEQTAAARRTIEQLDLHYYVPCMVRGRTIAYVGLGRTKEGDFLSSEDVALVQAACGYFAIALENGRLYRSLEAKAGEYERLKNFNENIVESLSVGILVVDLQDRVQAWNTQLELIFGISRQQAVGRPLSELLPVALADEFARTRGESGIRNLYKFRVRADEFPAEFRPAPRRNGAAGPERLMNVAIAPLIAKNFDAIGRLVILDDVTERVELEQQLVQADKLSSIGLLAAGVAHEVNTPLAVISSYAQMLAKKAAADPAQSKILEKITSQTFRASEIVNSLLSFSRTADRELREIDLNETIETTLALIEPQMRKAHVRVSTEFDPAAAAIRGNAGKLQQVFLNLFLNARDAMREGGRLTVRTSLLDAPNGEPMARVEVSDNGPGIDPDHLGRIFDPFFTTKGPRQGTGLGLAVTYGIVQEHLGNITVESSPGRGATFHVDLPVVRKPIHA